MSPDTVSQMCPSLPPSMHGACGTFLAGGALGKQVCSHSAGQIATCHSPSGGDLTCLMGLCMHTSSDPAALVGVHLEEAPPTIRKHTRPRLWVAVSFVKILETT